MKISQRVDVEVNGEGKGEGIYRTDNVVINKQEDRGIIFQNYKKYEPTNYFYSMIHIFFFMRLGVIRRERVCR